MTGTMALGILSGGFAIMLTLLLPVVLATGILGRPRPTRPRCGSCRAPLGGTAVLPSACPACAATLEGPGAVRFGGYRVRWRPLIWALVIAMLASVPTLLLSLRATRSVGVVNGLVVERGAGTPQYDKATAAGDAAAWAWISAHLQFDAFDEALRARAAGDLVQGVRSGAVDAVFFIVYPKLADLVDGAALAEALLERTTAATATLDRRDPTRLVIEVHRSIPSIGAGMVDGAPWLVLAVTEVRVDGVPVRPASPTGRFVAQPPMAQVVLPFGIAKDDPMPCIEVDTVTAVVRDPPRWLREARLPGPPALWPGVQALRRETLLVDAPLAGENAVGGSNP